MSTKLRGLVSVSFVGVTMLALFVAVGAIKAACNIACTTFAAGMVTYTMNEESNKQYYQYQNSCLWHFNNDFSSNNQLADRNATNTNYWRTVSCSAPICNMKSKLIGGSVYTIAGQGCGNSKNPSTYVKTTCSTRCWISSS